MDLPVRWGIISTANINRMVIPAIRASKRCRLVGVASRTEERVRQYATEWQIPRTYSSYESMLADPEIDAVYISLPNHLHAEWAIRAARAGKHVLLEKPIALSPSEVDAIISASRESGQQIVEAFMYRSLERTFKIQQLLADQALGQIRLVRGCFSFMHNRPTDVRMVPEYGGGCLWDIGCYPVSYAQMVAGQKPVQVFGTQYLGVSGVDMSFFGQLLYPDGQVCQFYSSFELPPITYVEIYGSQGSLHIPTPYSPRDPNLPILLKRGDKEEKLFFPPVAELYQGEVEDLVDAALGLRPPRVSLSESREINQTLAALYLSARTGKSVEL